jgi:Cu(I)/Ag(I) efflux system protein CusF
VYGQSQILTFLELHMTRLFSLVNTFILSAGLALTIANASAQMQMPMHEHGQHGAMPATTTDDPAALSHGEVKKVDKDTGKLTIKHGPLNNLNMPGMTMAFKVQDPTMLDQVKVGDQIQFRVESLNGTYTVTKLEAAK